MRLRSSFIVAAAALTSLLQAQETYSTKGPLFGQLSLIEGRGYHLDVTWDQLFRGAIRWQVDEEEPPLLPHAAIARAREALKDFGGSREPWRLRKMELPETFTTSGGVFISYVLSFSRGTAKNAYFSGTSDDVTLIVLMSGEVLKPTPIK